MLTISGGKDPDEYIKNKGAEMFQLLIDNAESFVEYKIRKIEKNYNLEDTVEKIEFIEKIAKILAGIKNSVEREVYIKKLAKQMEISPDSITVQVENLARREQSRETARAVREEKREFEDRTGGRRDLDRMRLYNAEKLMLNLMCEKDVFKMVEGELEAKDFTEGLHRKLAEIIFACHAKGERVNPIEVISSFSEEDIGRVSEILSDDKNVDDKKNAARMPLKIMKNYKLMNNEKEFAESGDVDALQKIMEQLKKDKM